MLGLEHLKLWTSLQGGLLRLLLREKMLQISFYWLSLIVLCRCKWALESNEIVSGLNSFQSKLIKFMTCVVARQPVASQVTWQSCCAIFPNYAYEVAKISNQTQNCSCTFAIILPQSHKYKVFCSDSRKLLIRITKKKWLNFNGKLFQSSRVLSIC